MLLVNHATPIMVGNSYRGQKIAPIHRTTISRVMCQQGSSENITILPSTFYMALDKDLNWANAVKTVEWKRKRIELDSRIGMFLSPVGLAVILEVVHVTASCRVQRIFGLPFLSAGNIQQVSVVLYHKLSLREAPGRKHPPSFVNYVLHLLDKKSLIKITSIVSSKVESSVQWALIDSDQIHHYSNKRQRTIVCFHPLHFQVFPITVSPY